MPGTIAQRLAEQRRREFVGRADEVASCATCWRGRDGAVLFVSGPGGVGKTTLLGRYADLGRELGRLVVRLDARELPPIASAYLAEIAAPVRLSTPPTTRTSRSAGSTGCSCWSTPPNGSPRWIAGCARSCCPPWRGMRWRCSPAARHPRSRGALTPAGTG